MDYKKTGQLISECRRENGLTQVQLAEKIGVSNRAVSKWECGVGFPDVSILEHLADALNISVIELLHGERENINIENDMEVREAIRIIRVEAKLQFSRIKRVAKVCIILLLGLSIGWGVFEFFITNGDGFNPIENSTVMKQGYENGCKTFLKRGIYKIEVSSGKKQITITDLDVIDSLLKTLGKIEVGKNYKNWGPQSLNHTIRLYASGWSPSGQFIDTEDYEYELTFPAFSVVFFDNEEDAEEIKYYYCAEIDNQEAWDAIENVLEQWQYTFS